jgi:peptidoglycan hydrolase-like protein with peptidoglycan-binding domain
MLRSIRLGRIRALQLAASNNPPLMVGQTNDGVATVQLLLRDLGYDFPVSFRKGKADGVFGSETKRSVEAFQKKSALKADGIVGRMTLEKLDDLIVKNNILEEHTEIDAAMRDMRNRSAPTRQKTRMAT